MKRIEKFFFVCGVLGPPIFLASLFIFGSMVPAYDPLNQYISELGAVGSPVQTLTNLFSFNLFGVLIILFSIGLLITSETGISGKIAGLLFLLAGVSMFLVGVFPCDPLCYGQSVAGDLHNKFSFYPFPLITLGFLLFLVEAVRKPIVRSIIPLIIIFGLTSLILRVLTVGWPPVPYLGAVQRAAIGLPFLVMMAIALIYYRKVSTRGSSAILFSLAITLIIISSVGMLWGIGAPQKSLPFICPENKNCEVFCQNNFGRCEKYCEKYTTHPLCLQKFYLETLRKTYEG